MNSQTGLPLGFEFVDIEIINHKNENDIDDRWNCDHCSLFFLSKDKLELHQKVHSFVEDTVHCKYCNKVLTGEESKECYSNKKCETCEYRCSQCPQRFLRQSSLLNHEKNHLTVKKRRSRNITFHTKQADEVDAQANNSSKKRKALKNNPEESLIETDSLQPIISPKKKSKVESDGFSPEKSKASTFVNISSRRSSRKILPDKSLTSPDKSKLNESVNKVQVVAMTDGSAKENSVNYKPFSCHVCGETFASDNGLLEHIKTHGDNAAETFKCKYCGDKFDDIYKMQYHLAICPHAEDELESSLVKNLTPKTTPMKPSIETPSSSVNGSNPPRKRGRPFKIRNVIPPQTEPENSDNNTSASHRTRSRITKQTVVNVDPSPNTQAKLARKPRRSIKGVSDFSEDCDDGVNESLGVSAKRLDESGSDDESRRKIHQCPHPSCGLKFTREKAMLCHYRNHEDSDGTVKCYKCGIPFDDDRELTTHIKECKSIKEENDSEDFEPVDEYDKKPYGKVRGGYMCKICGKTYITNDRLKRHECIVESNPLVKKKLPNMKHWCNLCELEFKNEIEENNHMIRHARMQAGFPCNMCFQICSSEKALLTHYKEAKHNKGGSRILHDLLNCSNLYEKVKENLAKDGNINFEYKMAFANNNVIKNSNTKENKWYFSCVTCNKNFDSESSVIEHEKIHLVSCPICEITLDNFQCLKEHVHKNHVKGLRNLQCKICDNKKDTEAELTNHVLVHAKRLDSHRDEVLHSIRPLETDDQNCNATVLNESVETSGLLVNKRRASYYRALNETRVSCPICLKSYSENSHLKLHLLNKHANQSDNCMCCLCQQIETSKKDLVEHLLTHKASAQDRLKSGKENLQDESDHTIDGSRISANSGIKGERAHNHVQEKGNSSASDIKFYELTNNNITVCGIVPERSDFCDSDKVDNKLLELPIKGAICTVCSETLHTPSKLGSHKNVLVYC